MSDAEPNNAIEPLNELLDEGKLQNFAQPSQKLIDISYEKHDALTKVIINDAVAEEESLHNFSQEQIDNYLEPFCNSTIV